MDEYVLPGIPTLRPPAPLTPAVGGGLTLGLEDRVGMMHG